MKYLAIDYGAKRLGLAICDPAGRVAVPLTTFARGTNDANGDIARLMALIRGLEVEGLVFGKPGGSQGSDTTLGAAQRFAARLQIAAETSGLNLHLNWWDGAWPKPGSRNGRDATPRAHRPLMPARRWSFFRGSWMRGINAMSRTRVWRGRKGPRRRE